MWLVRLPLLLFAVSKLRDSSSFINYSNLVKWFGGSKQSATPNGKPEQCYWKKCLTRSVMHWHDSETLFFCSFFLIFLETI